MKNVKLIVSDLDQTLLNDKKQISTADINSIKSLEVPLVIASGRPIFLIKKYYKELNLKTPVICSNGAMIFDVQKNEPIFTEKISCDLATKIYDFLQKNDYPFMIYTDNSAYMTNKNPRAIFWEKYNETAASDEKAPINYIDFETFDLTQNNILKFLCINADQNLETSLNEKFNSNEELNICFSEKGILEVTDKRASKGMMLKKICELKKIEIENVVAVGDNFNDISMLTVAGISLTVSNAEPSIKKIANDIGVSNNESPLTQIIKKYID